MKLLVYTEFRKTYVSEEAYHFLLDEKSEYKSITEPNINVKPIPIKWSDFVEKKCGVLLQSLPCTAK